MMRMPLDVWRDITSHLQYEYDYGTVGGATSEYEYIISTSSSSSWFNIHHQYDTSRYIQGTTDYSS